MCPAFKSVAGCGVDNMKIAWRFYSFCLCVCVSSTHQWKRAKLRLCSHVEEVDWRCGAHCQQLLETRCVCSLWQHTNWWQCFPVVCFPLMHTHSHTPSRSFCVSLATVFLHSTTCLNNSLNHTAESGQINWYVSVKMAFNCKLKYVHFLCCNYMEMHWSLGKTFLWFFDRELIFWVTRRDPVWAIQVRVITLQWKCT